MQEIRKLFYFFIRKNTVLAKRVLHEIADIDNPDPFDWFAGLNKSFCEVEERLYWPGP